MARGRGKNPRVQERGGAARGALNSRSRRGGIPQDSRRTGAQTRAMRALSALSAPPVPTQLPPTPPRMRSSRAAGNLARTTVDPQQARNLGQGRRSASAPEQREQSVVPPGNMADQGAGTPGEETSPVLPARADPARGLPTSVSQPARQTLSTAEQTVPANYPGHMGAGPSHRPLGESGPGSWPVVGQFPLASCNSVGGMGSTLQVAPAVFPSGSGEAPLLSICDPLGATTPTNIKEKIIKSEFIDLDVLLERNFMGAPTDSSFTVGLDKSGQLLLREGKKKPQITSISCWTDAFLVLSSIFVAAHPERALEMFKYMNTIRLAATRFGGWGWREYDRQFRMRQHLRPHRSWATIDGELWAMYLSAPGLPPRGFEGQRRSTLSSSKQHSFRGRYIPCSTGVCFAFNRAGCSNTSCKYAHKCSLCQSPDHGESNCKGQNRSITPRR